MDNFVTLSPMCNFNIMADQSSMDSLQELSGMAKISSNSDTSFNPTRQFISPSYNMNNVIKDKVFEATIENANVGGRAMDASAVNQDRVPEVPLISDVCNILLQNQILMQNMMKKQMFSTTDSSNNVKKKNSRKSATISRAPAPVVMKHNKHYDNYQSQLDNLFDVNNNKSAHSEQLYFYISSAESNDESVYDSDDDCTGEDELVDIGSKKNNTENDNVLESMKDFISTEEKSGPKINTALAAYMNQGLRTRPNEDMLKVPRVNLGIWRQMTTRNKDVDVKLQHLQNLLSKAACPMMYMMDMFLEKSSNQQPITIQEVQSYTVTCKNTYQLLQAGFSEITFITRSFIKGDIQPQYKGLCDDTTPVTEMLFGDDIKKEVTIREFAQVIGKLVATQPGVQFAPLYIKSLEITKDILLKCHYGNFDAKMILSDENTSDLNWLRDSSSKAWGAVVQDTLLETKGFWLYEEQKNHINFLELKAVLLSLKWFCSSKEKNHAQVYVDNMVALNYINKMGGRIVKLNKLTKELWNWCIKREIWVAAFYLPGVANIEADRLSRSINVDIEWKLNENVFHIINSLFGPHDVDLFASKINHQLPRYFSYFPDSYAEAVNQTCCMCNRSHISEISWFSQHIGSIKLYN
ncbi:unnamed protein product [Mytilus coruscus]|uniref:RNase H type-1 domain-containing protein n=1 Tax=Mytilus coruscus TaxID=42192 RepID=A0A6J8D7E7_MYTCO|nr:unnamed protein product [Mytilus coruscus]